MAIMRQVLRAVDGNHLTLRTGNAWVHALSYHAVAPHVIVDTPLMVKIFGIVP